MDGIKSQVKSTAKAAAAKTAKQMAMEPLEILKQAKGQVITPPESTESRGATRESSVEENSISPEEKAKKQEQELRLKTALDAELADIRNKRKEKEEVRQKDFATQVESTDEQQVEQPLVEPTNKPKRGLFFGVKTRIERMKQKVENRLPPSG